MWINTSTLTAVEFKTHDRCFAFLRVNFGTASLHTSSQNVIHRSSLGATLKNWFHFLLKK